MRRNATSPIDSAREQPEAARAEERNREPDRARDHRMHPAEAPGLGVRLERVREIAHRDREVDALEIGPGHEQRLACREIVEATHGRGGGSPSRW